MGRSRLVCVFTGFPKVQSIRLRRLFQPPVPDSVDFGIPVLSKLGSVKCFVSRVRGTRIHEKHKQNCCADDSNAFHECCLDTSLSGAGKNNCLLLTKERDGWLLRAQGEPLRRRIRELNK